MKELEQLILSKSRPVQKEAKPIGVSELDKLIMEALLGEQQTDISAQDITDKVIAAIQRGLDKAGYETTDLELEYDDAKRLTKINIPQPVRYSLARSIKGVLEPYKQYTVHPRAASNKEVIGYALKKGNRVVLDYILKPLAGTGIRNKGDVAEGILGAGVAASFIKGTSITTEDIASLLAELDKQKNTAEGKKTTAKSLSQVLKRDDGTTDQITLDVRLAKRNFADLMNLQKRPALMGLFKSVAAYVNSEEVLSASEAVMVDQLSSKILILSDGVTGQKKTKIDVRVFMDGVETAIGKISLKAGGTKQLGQVGKSWKDLAGPEGMFKTVFGIQPDKSLEQQWINATTLPALRTVENIKNAGYDIYENAYNKIKARLAGDNLGDELDFLSRLAKGIRYQAVLDEWNVSLVHLDAGDFKILDFYKLEKVLKDLDLDVKLQRVSSKGAISPKLIIYDKESGKGFVSMRVKVEKEGGTIRHYIEKEPLMVDLINVAKKQKKKEKKNKAEG